MIHGAKRVIYLTFVFGPGMDVFMEGPLKVPSTPTSDKPRGEIPRIASSLVYMLKLTVKHPR